MHVSVWCQPSCMNFGVIFHPVLEFFLDPLWPLLTIFPINRLVLYSIFFLLPQPLLLLSQQSHASSVLVLITAALCTFLVYGYQFSSNRVWATMRKTWESSSRGMPPSTNFLFVFLHHCITILN